ncbi:MAG: hypothetical protein JWR68_2994 [Polaromonas sp.]|nr:hypothetical protein [Polaromonas sp.]
MPDRQAASFAVASQLKWAGLLLGVALSGFFDGIVLHQLLQWHHLLSAVEVAPWRDLRMQILADGAFHVLMYIVAVAGLVLLCKARRNFALQGADRYLLAYTLTGFGAWNILDAVVFHWITGIHRIKMTSDQPLLWDLFWFFAFGVLFIAMGHAVKRGADAAGGASGRTPAAATSLGLLVAASGALAALAPANGGNDAVVVFRPGITAAQAFNAIGRIDGKVTWVDGAGAVWAIKLDQPATAQALYRSGALLVSRSAIGLGCLSWTRTAAHASTARNT